MNDLASLDKEEDVKLERQGTSEEPFDDDAEATNVMVLDDEDNIKEDDLSKIIIKEIGDIKKLTRLISIDTMDSVLQRIDKYGNTQSLNG